MSPRGETAGKKEFVLVISGMIVISTLDFISHSHLRILH